ncbi:MAG: hypothetical protein ACI9MC_001742, partial [Kiritimatiellia bacterium]
MTASWPFEWDPVSVDIEPALPGSVHDVRVIADFPGASEDDLQVRWTRDGQPAPDLDDQLVLSSEHTRRNERWRVHVQVHGVDGVLREALREFTIANGAPQVRSVQIERVLDVSSSYVLAT